jgi:hypothetical protein
MLNLKEYIDGIKAELNVPADYVPQCYYNGNDEMKVKFQIAMEQLPKSFDFARNVVSPLNYMIDCTFTLSEQITSPSDVSCQITYWTFSDMLVNSHYQFRSLMEMMKINENVPKNTNKKYIAREGFIQKKSEVFPLTEIVNKFKQYLGILRSNLYAILKIAQDPRYEQYFASVNEIEQKIQALELQKRDLYTKMHNQIDKDIKIYKEFEL